MFYSHTYDFLAKLLLFVLMVATFFILQIDHWQQFMMTHWGLREGQVMFFIIVTITAFFLLPLFAFVYLPFLSPAAAWCYLRFSLKTPVSWAIAKKTESLFRPTLKRMQWFPLKDLKEIPQEEREEALLLFFNEVQSNPDQYGNKSWMDEYLRQNLSKNGYRAFQITLLPIALWVLYGTFDQSGIPGWLSRLQANYLFSGNHYPMLSFLFAMVVFALLLAALFLLFSRMIRS